MTTGTASMRRAHVTAPQAAQGGWHLAAWLAELAGTAIMVLGGLSAVVLDAWPPPSWRATSPISGST